MNEKVINEAFLVISKNLLKESLNNGLKNSGTYLLIKALNTLQEVEIYISLYLDIKKNNIDVDEVDKLLDGNMLN